MVNFKSIFPNVRSDPRSYEPAGDKLVLSRCRIGLEMEVEGAGTFLEQRDEESGLLPISDFWADHEDNSLKDQGREFVLAGPLFGQDLVDAINEFCGIAKEWKFRVSARTGLHVHLDVRNLTMQQIASLCFAYAILEKPLFRFAGLGRAENHFCVPWYTAQSNLRYLYPLVFASSTNKMRNAVENQEKYSALNLLPISKYGSIEFRHMETTYDSARILEWVNIIMRLKDYARRQDEPTNVLKVFSAGPIAFARGVLQDHDYILNYGEVEKDLWDGLNLALVFTVNQDKAFGELADAFKQGRALKPEEHKEKPKSKTKDKGAFVTEMNALAEGGIANWNGVNIQFAAGQPVPVDDFEPLQPWEPEAEEGEQI